MEEQIMGQVPFSMKETREKETPKKYPKQYIDSIFQKARFSYPQSTTSMNSLHTFKTVQGILLRSDHKQLLPKAQEIQQMAGFWSEYELQDLYDNPDVVGLEKLQIYRVWIVTARVIQKMQQFFKKLQWRKQFSHEAYQNIQTISEYMQAKELQFAPQKNCLSQKGARFSMSKYSIEKFTKENKEQQMAKTHINKIYQLAIKQKVNIVVKLFDFLSDIGVIELQGKEAKINNEFMNSLDRIHRREQQETFIRNYACINYESMKSYYEEQKQEELMKELKLYLPNYCFYKNQLQIRYEKMKLKDLHRKYEDYEFLEDKHDYIQWMFPNHYGSAFNSSSKPLNYIESELFLKDNQARLSLFYSVFIFIDFMGLQLDFQSKQFIISSRQRLSDVILRHYHNHLRIMRIFACLSVTGLRQIALKLIKFLNIHTSKGKMLQKERYQFEREWKIYDDQELQLAKDMCFLEYETFPESETFINDFINIAQNFICKKYQSNSQTKEQQLSVAQKLEKEPQLKITMEEITQNEVSAQNKVQLKDQNLQKETEAKPVILQNTQTQEQSKQK